MSQSRKQTEIADDALIGTATPGPAKAGPSGAFGSLPLLAVIAAVLLVLTLIGALTSPPACQRIPTGHLVYLGSRRAFGEYDDPARAVHGGSRTGRPAAGT